MIEDMGVEEVNSPMLNAEEEEQQENFPDEEMDSQTEDSVETEEESVELEPEDELWPDGPRWKHILAWKEQYGDESVYVTSLTPTKHQVWRTLTRFEYRRLVKTMEQAIASGTISQAEANLNNEEAITEMCCLFPMQNRQSLAAEDAGLASIISQEVMEASGFLAMEVRQL